MESGYNLVRIRLKSVKIRSKSLENMRFGGPEGTSRTLAGPKGKIR